MIVLIIRMRNINIHMAPDFGPAVCDDTRWRQEEKIRTYKLQSGGIENFRSLTVE